MEEIWNDVVGFEGRYQVSNLGRVRSLDRVVKTTKSEMRLKGKLLSPAPHSHGYLVVNLRNGASVGKVCYVHRLVAEAFFGKSNLLVNHKDLNRQNNDLRNLEFVTNFENLLHAAKNGIKVGRTILNSEQRKEIRKLRKQGLKLKEIGKIYSLSESAVSEVARGTTWKWEKK